MDSGRFPGARRETWTRLRATRKTVTEVVAEMSPAMDGRRSDQPGLRAVITGIAHHRTTPDAAQDVRELARPSGPED